MNKKIKIILITIILMLSLLLINQAKYRNDELYAVNLKNKIDKDLVSILVSDGSENYTKYEESTFPSNTEYTYNSELSKCQDNNGKVIEGILSYIETTGKVNIITKKTTNCYLYFDKKSTPFSEELIASGELWQSGLEGDGYRYTGSGNAESSTSPNNFICFGTNSLSECKANESKYMYRIIGVFPDDAGVQHLKLVKYKQLPETYSWHSDGKVDIPWEESNLYKGLNGINGGSYSNLFIGNTAYNYLQDTNWSNKIVDWKWTATNTLTYTNSGASYFTITAKQMYLHEMNRSTKTNSNGKWTYPTAKIGLMYASDYMLSLGSSSLTMISESDFETLKTGWLHPSNNDTTVDTSEKWFISSVGCYPGFGNGYFYAWSISVDGYVSTNLLKKGTLSPVFYLESNVEILDGTGSYNNPYIIAL